jgi:tRNA A-37 threonylcarbamoyl transferase component Bud32
MQRRADAAVEAPPASQAFHTLRDGPCFLRVAAGFEAEARRLGLLTPGGLERLLTQASGPRGRAPTAVLELAQRPERLHLRAVRHGGLLAPLWSDRLLGLGRPIRELETTAGLLKRGAPVPRPVLVAARHLRGPWVRAAVATLYEEDSIDGIAFLAAGPTPERSLAACAAAGRAVRRLHDAGGRHRDLHLGNLLLRERDGRCECLIVDLDRARLVHEASPAARMSELGRLFRSLVKRELWNPVGDDGCRAFLDAYSGEEPALRAALLAHLPRERRRLAWRRRLRRLLTLAGPRAR